jgi:peptidoglycan/xylan/chitin deacetylase (PgdA/CDA1 family)
MEFMLELRRPLKSILGRLVFRTGLYRRLQFGCGAIVVFHRIDDRYPTDPITISWKAFDEFIDFFQRYFEVIPLGELLDRLHDGRPIENTLAITFDDGYLDNVEAARRLTKAQLPATFFITTGFVESTLVPWWDRDQGIQSEWMTWSDVREVRAMGFEIGAHTQNHIDLGVARGAEAEREIAGSREILEQRIGEPITQFSYPFGRPSEMTDENRQLVRDVGLRCSPSAFGGNVAPGDSPYHLNRQPICRWHLSAFQFGWEYLSDCRIQGLRRTEAVQEPDGSVCSRD